MQQIYTKEAMRNEKEVVKERLGSDVLSLMAVYYTTTGASEMFLREVERSLAFRKCEFKREDKRIYHDLLAAMKRLFYLYDRLTQRGVENSDSNGADVFDVLLNDSNCIASFILRYYNATYHNQDNAEKINEFLDSLSNSKVVFSDKMISKFEMKTTINQLTDNN